MNQNTSPVIIGCDHAAFRMKEIISADLKSQGIEVVDVGAFSEVSVDYPDIAVALSSRISKGEFQHGILLCGTGIGMSMAANRFPGVRAARCSGIFDVLMSRRHNDANILVLGGRVLGDTLALEMVRIWLETPFEGDRHQRRLDKFDTISRVENR